MLPLLSSKEQLDKILNTKRPGEENILAYYEHRLGGICKDPRLMLLPLDDHLAHRGDGVFETVKYVDGRLYRFDEHLERMRRSADGVFLEPPCSWEEMRSIIIEVAAAGKEKTGVMRILIGRGPGGFGISTLECPESSLYVVSYRFSQHDEAWYQKGLKGFRTSIPAKQGYLARIKNANYLPNTLMVMEANKRNMDVPFCFSEDNYLAESAVANIFIVDKEGTLVSPKSNNALSGTVANRALELAEGKVAIKVAPISEDDIRNAREAMMLGTGPECVAIVSYEGQSIGNGKEGEVVSFLRKLIREDVRNTGTPVPGLV